MNTTDTTEDFGLQRVRFKITSNSFICEVRPLQIVSLCVKKLKQKNMWTLRILKEPMKYQTIGGFLFRLFGVRGRFYTDKEIEKIKYLSFLQGKVDGDTGEE
jgi:hypothetical protein